MARSNTKYEASRDEIVGLFRGMNLGEVTDVEALGNGEFNAAFRVGTSDRRSYVLKIAPPANARVLTYEKNMMESEVYWYERIREHTQILIPEVFASSFDGTKIPAPFFVMEWMPGEPLWAVNFTEKEYEGIQEQKIHMLTQIHGIHNDRFGYRQTGLHPTWYEAIRSMAEALVRDCEDLGLETPNGHRLLTAIDRHEELLRTVPCCMVNFDLWDSNVLYHEGKLCWIDPERSFWGDAIADFITLGPGQKTPLSGKQKEIGIYQRWAETPVVYGRDAEIRYQIAVGYLALIEEVEKYVRYVPGEPNYIRNTEDAEAMFDMAFEILL